MYHCKAAMEGDSVETNVVVHCAHPAYGKSLRGTNVHATARVRRGWRSCKNDEEVRSLAGMDPQKLNLIRDQQLQVFQGPWSIVIIRHGYLVAEWFGVPTMPHTTFDVWSCTKSATGLAFGLLLDDSLHHKLPHDAQITLDTPVYDFVPEGHPLTDPEKQKIKLRNTLTMTSGIAGESRGVIGLAVAPRSGEYEFALGKSSTALAFLPLSSSVSQVQFGITLTPVSLISRCSLPM